MPFVLFLLVLRFIIKKTAASNYKLLLLPATIIVFSFILFFLNNIIIDCIFTSEDFGKMIGADQLYDDKTPTSCLYMNDEECIEASHCYLNMDEISWEKNNSHCFFNSSNTPCFRLDNQEACDERIDCEGSFQTNNSGVEVFSCHSIESQF